MLPRIKQIINIENIFVFCEWTNGDKRAINFAQVVELYPVHLKDKILNKNILSTIKLNHEAQTLYLPNLLDSLDGNLDFCPDMLYAKSEVLSKTPNLNDE